MFVGVVAFLLPSALGLSIAGLMGAGRTELAMSVFGRSYGRDIRGTVHMHGRPVKIRNVAEAIRHGIAYVSEDRVC